MSTIKPTPSFVGWRALVVHKAHPNVDAIMLQFERIGVAAVHCWPEATGLPDIDTFNVVLIDADMGYDGQFPWNPGEAPMPTIALIGSEAPGRVSWAMNQGADAQLLKPIGGAGLYSALVAACHAFARRKALAAEVEGLRARLESREILAEATALHHGSRQYQRPGRLPEIAPHGDGRPRGAGSRRRPPHRVIQRGTSSKMTILETTPVEVAHAPARGVWGRLIRRPLAVFGLIIIAVVVVAAVFAPWLAPRPQRAVLRRADAGRRAAAAQRDSSGSAPTCSAATCCRACSTARAPR